MRGGCGEGGGGAVGGGGGGGGVWGGVITCCTTVGAIHRYLSFEGVLDPNSKIGTDNRPDRDITFLLYAPVQDVNITVCVCVCVCVAPLYCIFWATAIPWFSAWLCKPLAK